MPNMSLYFPFFSNQPYPACIGMFCPGNCIETALNEVESEQQHINNLLQQPERNIEAIVVFILIYLADNANVH